MLYTQAGAFIVIITSVIIAAIIFQTLSFCVKKIFASKDDPTIQDSPWFNSTAMITHPSDLIADGATKVSKPTSKIDYDEPAWYRKNPNKTHPYEQEPEQPEAEVSNPIQTVKLTQSESVPKPVVKSEPKIKKGTVKVMEAPKRPLLEVEVPQAATATFQ